MPRRGRATPGSFDDPDPSAPAALPAEYQPFVEYGRPPYRPEILVLGYQYTGLEREALLSALNRTIGSAATEAAGRAATAGMVRQISDVVDGIHADVGSLAARLRATIGMLENPAPEGEGD